MVFGVDGFHFFALLGGNFLLSLMMEVMGKSFGRYHQLVAVCDAIYPHALTSI